MTEHVTAADEATPEGNPLREPPRCLSFTITGDWAHFRRVEGTVVKQTYRVPPRTTIAGLLAAIVGRDRDEYYETFRLPRSAIAVEVCSDLRTVNMPTNILTTTRAKLTRPEDATRRKTVKVRYPTPTAERQQHNFELLTDPRYRIDVYTEDEGFYEELRTALTSGRSHYTPSLGLSECLARITDVTEYESDDLERLTPGGSVITVDSTVPHEIGAVVPDGRVSFERSPAAMEKIFPGGRRTTAFRDIAYSPDDALEVRSSDVPLVRVGDRTVVFG